MKVKSLFLLAAVAFFASCGEDGKKSSEVDSYSEKKVFVFGSDYTTGELRYFNSEEDSFAKEALNFNQDSKIIFSDDALYILERFGADNFTKVNIEDFASGNGKKSVEFQVHLEDGSNPSDLVFQNDSIGWLALENAPKILKVNTKNGELIDSIDVSSFSLKGNVSPNVKDLELKDGMLYALMQRLDNYVPTTAGLVAIYNSEKGTLVDTISIKTVNPMALVDANETIYIGTLGGYNANWGVEADANRGIEILDLSKRKSKMLIDGKSLGGGVYSIVADENANIIYASVMNTVGQYGLKKVNLDDLKITEIKGVSDASVLFFDEMLFIGDRTFSAEKFYTYDGKNLKEIKMDNALPPYSIAVAP